MLLLLMRSSRPPVIVGWIQQERIDLTQPSLSVNIGNFINNNYPPQLVVRKAGEYLS